jgi:hypothetical protein
MELIIYDGIGKQLEVTPDETVQTILKHAESLFGLLATDSVSLFTESGRELPANETVRHAGLSKEEKLFLRPRPDKIVFDVVIIYNGIKKLLEVKRDELFKVVLQKAIALFGSLPNPHTLALFTEAGRELPENETVKQVGLRPDEKLLLRPSTVKGG